MTSRFHMMRFRNAECVAKVLLPLRREPRPIGFDRRLFRPHESGFPSARNAFPRREYRCSQKFSQAGRNGFGYLRNALSIFARSLLTTPEFSNPKKQIQVHAQTTA